MDAAATGFLLAADFVPLATVLDLLPGCVFAVGFVVPALADLLLVADFVGIVFVPADFVSSAKTNGEKRKLEKQARVIVLTIFFIIR